MLHIPLPVPAEECVRTNRLLVQLTPLEDQVHTETLWESSSETVVQWILDFQNGRQSGTAQKVVLRLLNGLNFGL